MRIWTLMCLATLLAGCPKEDGTGSGTTPTGTAGTTSAVDFDCDHYCDQGNQDVVDSGCDNAVRWTQAEIDECAEQCEYSIALPTCGELFAIFWQCTLDAYPGQFECDADGNPAQPTDCDAEQQAVLDCM